MKFSKWICLAAVAVMIGAAFTAPAADDRLAQSVEKKLGVTFDLTYMSKYMYHGMQCYGDHGVLFEKISLDLWGSGFSISAGHESATMTSGFVNSQRMTYTVGYANSLFKDSIFKTDYKVSWSYKQYYDNSRDTKNRQTINGVFTWPKLFECGIVPKYAICYETPAGSDYGNRTVAGTVHTFGLGYNWKLEALPNPLHLSVDMAYNDGYGGTAIDHDFCCVTLGMATRFNITENLSFGPGIYYQITLDESTNRENNVAYTILNLKYKF